MLELSRLPDGELRHLLVEAARASLANSTSLDRRGCVRAALELRESDKASPRAASSNYEFDPHGNLDRVITALWWEWCITGHAIPLFRDAGSSRPTYIDAIHFTPVGVAALRGGIPPHPLSEAYRGGLDGLDDEMKARLEDAALCFRASLPRAAVFMVGIAYEHAVELVAQAFAIKDKLHAQRLESLRKRLESVSDKDARSDALFALSLARMITIERNGAGHPGAYERPNAEVEEFVWRAPHWLRQILAARALAPITPESQS